jgi:AI-2 transport protein TqsA
MSPLERTLPPNSPAPRRDLHTLTVIALCLVSAAAAWYLLEQLALLLRPLCLAIFLSYALVPLYGRLKQRIPGPASYAVMAAGIILILGAIALIVQSSVVELKEELPGLFERGRHIANHMETYLREQAPGVWQYIGLEGRQEANVIGKLHDWAYSLVDSTANMLAEGVAVAVYLLFFLLESQRFRRRVYDAFPRERAERILFVMSSINDSIARYVEVKTVASLVLALPAALVLWLFGVKFALLWGIVTFFCNFIPYIGSFISISLPLLLAFLIKDSLWQPITVGLILIAIHMTSAYLFEPMITGRASGLSPLIVVASLVFWGHAWGVIGMLLAVPLTAIVKIALENVEFTRPVARLMGED